MASAYRLDFYDTTGALRAQLAGTAAGDPQGRRSGFLDLAYTKRVNVPGALKIALDGRHELVKLLADKWLVEVWRRTASRDWYRDFVAVYRQPEWSYDRSPRFAGICSGLLSMLTWRIVNWPAGVSGKSEFRNVRAETIMKTLVDANAGAGATMAAGRKRDGVIAGVSVETDAGRGAVLDFYCHGQKLLEALQDLAAVGGGDFDLVRTGPQAYEFRFFEGQRGQDRTGQVVFSVERNNMSHVSYTESRLDEATVACVWGQGEGVDRDYTDRTGANYDAGNDIEVYVSATDVPLGETSGLAARGDQKLKELEATAEFKFKALERPGSMYGVDYEVGDLVSVVNPFSGQSLAYKVAAVTVSFSDGAERIEPEFVTP